MPPDLTVAYGPEPSQHVEAWLPEGRPRRAAVLVHGGWWRDRFDLHLMDGLCADLVALGWMAWNVEYRRTGGDGGGWRQSLDDVLAAVAALAEAVVPSAPDLEVGDLAAVAVGHSSGGHLALLAAAEGAVGAVAALAPVTDPSRCARAGLGEGAVPLFMGCGPDDDPDAYAGASPLHRVPMGVPQLVCHGDADDRVPFAHSRDHVARAGAAGDTVELVELAGADHFAVIDPTHPGWRQVTDWMALRAPAEG